MAQTNFSASLQFETLKSVHVPIHRYLQIFAWLIALPWLARFLDAAHSISRVPNLLALPADCEPQGHPALTVIVPARDEQASIAGCLESLLLQDYTNLRILAVDDRSTDATGALMDRLADGHPTRLAVMHITSLPAGWLGKTYAMAMAAAQALADPLHPPDLLLFTDGDILFAPDILRRTLSQAIADRADHFVTLPTTLVRTPGEAMLLSFLQVLGLFAVRPWRVASPGSRDAIGVGAFNLIRSSAYLKLGGFDAIPMEILEDLTLGRRVKSAGMRQRVAYAPGAVAVHWAPGLLGVLHGMTKNLFAVFRFRPALLLAATAALAVVWITPFALLFISGTRIPAALTVLSLVGLYVLVGRRNLISPWWAALAPVSAALLIYSMIRSMLVTLLDGGVNWRGTFYPLHSLREDTSRPHLASSNSDLKH